MIKQSDVRVWCEVTEKQYKALFHQLHKHTTLTRGKNKWNPKKQLMFAIFREKDRVFDLQTKIEFHPGKTYKQITADEMLQYAVMHFNRPKKDFEPAICRACGNKNLFWVTYPGTQDRVLVEPYKGIIITQTGDDKARTAKIVNGIHYVKHNDLHPECKQTIQQQQSKVS
jgi:hypothetical protein